MQRASAPGKVILGGEHAVVYGRPALVAAIDRRAYCSVEKSAEPTLAIPALGISEPIPGRSRISPFFLKGLETLSSGPLSIQVESQFPIGAGLGSSAAMACAFVKAASAELGQDLQIPDIQQKAHEMEKVVHTSPSGVDTTISANGGFFTYQSGKIERLEFADLPLIIGYTGRAGSTGKMIEKVKKMRDERPAETEKILDDIADTVVSMTEKLTAGDVLRVGELMDQNHEYLQWLGVSSPSLDKLVKAAKGAGAYGAKMTGGGGGGCMIALGGEDVGRAIAAAGGTIIQTQLSKEGVRIEGIS